MSGFSEALAARKAVRAVIERIVAAEGNITLSREELATLKAWKQDMGIWRQDVETWRAEVTTKLIQAKDMLQDHERRLKALEGG